MASWSFLTSHQPRMLVCIAHDPWPRGLTKARAALGEWCKKIAPSTELRKGYGHHPQRFEEFGGRCRTELAEPERVGALAHLRELASGQRACALGAGTDS